MTKLIVDYTTPASCYVPTTSSEAYTLNVYYTALGVVNDTSKREVSTDELYARGRTIANTVYDLKGIYSGMVSVAALLQRYDRMVAKMAQKQWTGEHYVTRKEAGKQVLDWAVQHPDFVNVTFGELVEKLNEFRRVHYTTSEENQRLRKYQNSDEYATFEESYAAAGIVLVNWPGTIRIKELSDRFPEILRDRYC